MSEGYDGTTDGPREPPQPATFVTAPGLTAASPEDDHGLRSFPMVHGDLMVAQWTFLEPLLPVGKKPGRPPKWTKRQLIDGIRWRTRAGVPWRDVPARYGGWQTVYGLFRRWHRDGTWKRILADLQADADAKGLIDWDASVGSNPARAHQHAAGARKRGACRRSPRAASKPSRTITGSDARALWDKTDLNGRVPWKMSTGETGWKIFGDCRSGDGIYTRDGKIVTWFG
ncbi:transposase [Streptomyces sp. NPDC057555]|uniref:transposase n=1 Tax=Streptomyces sp. NPDC057555 TaxID=3346166 RepID=UPI0036BFE809